MQLQSAARLSRIPVAMVGVSLLITATLVAGCADDDAGSSSGAGSSGAGAAQSRTGTITVGGETWTIVPAIQCSFFGGGVVAIAGHAAEDETIEIALDYDAQRGLARAGVEKTGAAPRWMANGEAIRFEIQGNTLRGEGTFTSYGSGASAEGSFEVTC